MCPKTLTPSSYWEYAGQYWRPGRMVMENHQNGKSTELIFNDWKFGSGASEKDFTASRLRRIK